MFCSKTCFRLIFLLLLCCVLVSLCAGKSHHRRKAIAKHIRRLCKSRYNKVLRAIVKNHEKCLKVFSQGGAKFFRKKCPRKAKLVHLKCKQMENIESNGNSSF
ncbi:uncharacterized protein LOC143469332 [Clavelina lepadiformis]|uniref:uncharacterized protein LOC143469332 n=1 Tax=Clavelina lepadiformis TaxID=159417 RepID=UPI0040436BDE